MQRSESVIQYLVNLGIPRTMLEATAMGSSVPLADESSPTERELNRRVDFQVLVRRCRESPGTPATIR
jgi:outer membrane protein OmpA-like peptidoglycan-associated protein